MKIKIILFLILFSISLHALSCTGPSLQKDFRPKRDAILFDVILFKGAGERQLDVLSYQAIAAELGLTCKVVDGNFINRREEFFDFIGRRKFKVMIFPGGDPDYWFEKRPKWLPPPAEGMLTHNINCRGVSNVLDFVKSGGSVIGICHCSTQLFSSRAGWLNPHGGDSGNLEKRYPEFKGKFNAICGTYAFKGIIVGPQEEVWPYPMALFLPLRMNPENEIVREAKVPPVVHIIVTGAGSIIPDEGQPLDVVAWFPNGTAAIGVVPYGSGRVILSGPHPNITGERVKIWRKVKMGNYAKWHGATEKTIQENWEKMHSNPDPDGPEPDWALAKAMLSYAYKEASK
jgi:hypothetical protein